MESFNKNQETNLEGQFYTKDKTLRPRNGAELMGAVYSLNVK